MENKMVVIKEDKEKKIGEVLGGNRKIAIIVRIEKNHNIEETKRIRRRSNLAKILAR